MVIVMLLGETLFSLVFRGLGGDRIVEEIMLYLPGGQLSFLLFVNVLVFILGFFLDYFEIVFIIVPLMAPIAVSFGYNLVWFGIRLGVNLANLFLNPTLWLFTLLFAGRFSPRGQNNGYLQGSGAVHCNSARGAAVDHPLPSVGDLGTRLAVHGLSASTDRGYV